MAIKTMNDVRSLLNSLNRLERNDHYIASLETIRDGIILSRENDPEKEKVSSRWDYPQILEDLDVYIRFLQSDPSASWDASWEARKELDKKGVLPDGWEKVERTRLTALWISEAEQTRMIVKKKVVRIHPKT